MARTRVTRRVTVAAIVGAASVALAGVLFFTPLVGTLLLGPALSALDARYGIVAQVGELDLGLTQLQLRATDVRLAARGHEAEPFLTIGELRVDLPWAALWRGLTIDDVSLTRPAVTVVRTATGRTNLPTGREDGDVTEESAPSLRLPIARLDVRDLTVELRDDVTQLVVSAPSTSLRLAGDSGVTRGPITMDGAATISWAGTATELTRLDGELGFDGATLDIHNSRTFPAQHAICGMLMQLRSTSSSRSAIYSPPRTRRRVREPRSKATHTATDAGVGGPRPRIGGQ